MSIYLVRHGETEWSLDGRHTGTTDIPLTAHGIEQAEATRPALAGHGPFALVLTSPLHRAVQTCEIAGFGAEAQTRDDLSEWNYGDYEGITTAQIRTERPDWSLWRDGVPDGESAEQVGARVDRVIAEARSIEGDTLVFGHGHCLRVLTARWVGLPPEDGERFVLDTATISILGYERETPVLRAWNLAP